MVLSASGADAGGVATPFGAVAGDPTAVLSAGSLTDTWADDTPPRVLLVEDDPGDALLVEELIADSDLTVTLTWAHSVEQARTELAAGAFDCVLLDLNLPDAHGMDALKEILVLAPDSAVVVLTGLAEEEAGLAAVAAGAQDFLVKGRVEAELFTRAVRYALERKRVERASAALQAGRLRAEENARLERGLLPRPLLRDGRVNVVARYHPGRAHALLGGDFYDVVQTPDGMTHAVVGDVSGHGPAEAALGVCLRVAWRSFVLAGARGSALLELLDQILVAERPGPEVFATLSHLTHHPGGATMEVTRAGHPGLLHRSADGGVTLREVSGGPALGLLPPGVATWPQTSVPVRAGECVVLFTDGLFEGRTATAGHERLGEEGLLDLARRHAHREPAKFVDALIDSAQSLAAPSGGLNDDLAVLLVEWTRS
ncbi:fused response regulator/phosphatase [Streptomyces sp. NPDC001941]|uniref:PP2C family protein-serine/threonine phosphatase n=1 Tax=Streptomyces sp. NPDC001941 TaxID=3154659 RepID=UPI0033268750